MLPDQRDLIKEPFAYNQGVFTPMPPFILVLVIFVVIFSDIDNNDEGDYEVKVDSKGTENN